MSASGAAPELYHDSLPLALLRVREAVMTLFRPVLHAQGLTEQQWRLIRVLHDHGELEFNRLAELACILRPSLTGILTRLERAGLVSRERNLPDQRKLSVSLTAAGQRCFRSLIPEVDRIYREVIEQRFPPQEMEELGRLLDKLRQLAESAPVD